MRRLRVLKSSSRLSSVALMEDINVDLNRKSDGGSIYLEGESPGFINRPAERSQHGSKGWVI